MKQITQTELIITRDNELDADYLYAKRVAAVHNVTGAVGSFVTNILHNVHTEVALAVHDSINHTSLRQEREQRLHDEREEAFKAKFKLV